MAEVKYIDLTPTWRSVVDILVEVAANGESQKARSDARAELRRMAEIADKHVAMTKAA